MPQNKNSFSRILSGGAIVSIGMIANNALQLIAGVLVVRLLTKDQYGDFSLGIVTIALLSTITLVGLPTVLVRAASGKANGVSDSEYRSQVLMSGLAMMLGLGMIAALSLFLLPVGRSNIGGDSYHTVLLILAFTIPMINAMAWLSAFYRIENNAAAKVIFQDILFNTLRVLMLAVAAYLAIDVIGILLIYLITTLISLVLYLFYFVWKSSGRYLRLADIKLATARDLLVQGGPVLGVGVIPLLGTWLIGAITTHFRGAEEFALFAAPNRLYAVFTIPLVAVGYLYLPIISAIRKSGANDDVKAMYNSASKWANLVALPVLAYAFLEAEFICTFLFGEEYRESQLALKVIVFTAFVQVFFGNNYLTVVVYEGGRILVAAALASLAALMGAGFVLIPAYGFIGAACTAMAMIVASNLVLSSWLFRKHRILPANLALIYNHVFAGIALFVLHAILAHYLSGVILAIVFMPLALCLSITVPILSMSQTEQDREVYGALRAKTSALLANRLRGIG